MQGSLINLKLRLPNQKGLLLEIWLQFQVFLQWS
jgi:hypothetical protein